MQCARNQVELCACVDFGIPRREVRSGTEQKSISSRNISLEIALLQAWSACAYQGRMRTFFPLQLRRTPAMHRFGVVRRGHHSGEKARAAGIRVALIEAGHPFSLEHRTTC
jgi:hypothetical protein